MPVKNVIRGGWIFFIIVLLVASPMVYFYNANKGLWWDEGVYLGLARNVYEGNGYWINHPYQETFRPPLFPLTIAGMWFLFGVSEDLVKLLPPLFALLSVILIYFLAKKLYGKEAGYWASFILGTSHFFLFYSEKLLTESMFIFLSIPMLYFLYTGVEDGKNHYLTLSGIFMAISFLTRYAGIILLLVYIIYPIIISFGKGKLLSIVKNWGFWSGLGLFFIILIPWFSQNILVFGSPVGAMLTGASTVVDGFYIAGWFFYFVNWIGIFGLIGLFAIPGIVFLVSRKTNSNVFILLLAVFSLVFFMLIPRKEERYLIHFFEVYFILFSVGVLYLRQRVKWSWAKVFISLIVIALGLMNLFAGIQMIQWDVFGGASLKQAGLWINENAPEGTKILSQNIPVLYYITGKEVVYFPDDEGTLQETIATNNISFVVLDAREPSLPDYVWVTGQGIKRPSRIFEQFRLEGAFQERGETFVWVYRTS